MSSALSQQTLAWSGRGHNTICESAVFLVKEEGLKKFLQGRGHIMGHLCNVPDIHWKNMGSETNKYGSPAHYIDPEILGLSIAQVPLNYTEIIKTYTGTKNKFKEGTIFSIPTELGSNWWRADQFFRRATSSTERWKNAPIPKGSKEEQDNQLPFNQLVSEFYINLGLMGHFVGDNGQPIHLTADYDGYKAGHGGIHAYFEEAVVSALPYDLMSNIVQKGLQLQKDAGGKNKSKLKNVTFLNEKTVLEKMRALGVLSFADIPRIYSLDPVIKASILKEEKGLLIKTPAQRKDPSTVTAAYEKMIVIEMARSATLLAQLWDMAYVQVGRPSLDAYRNYVYPFTPEFVPLDYIPAAESEPSTHK
ncbi:MAG: hypothetical protein COT73_02725 [Bdellovibrio sp. CG10_big_fil_rev_8_21_14_0_10_47_8]|nr:MAG: hypothetical protein COT73_02725 [Bdellovibrio sp. CG10_big_fil_rev_8_21_14_0_10_47_8]